MRKFLIYISNKHEMILRTIIIVASVLIIVNLMPHRIRYRLEYTKGKPWTGETLFAPYRFAILKSKDSLDAEKRQVMLEAPVCFALDTLVKKNVIVNFKKSVTGSFNGTIQNSKEQQENDKLIATGQQILNNIYATGIMHSTQKERELSGKAIMLITGNTFTYKNADEFYTIISARDYVHSFLFSNPAPYNDRLEQLLANVIEPDIYYDDVTTNQIKGQILENISLTRGFADKGDVIVAKGEVVDQRKSLLIESLRATFERRDEPAESTREVLAGHLALVSISISVLMIFVALFRKDVFADNRRLTMIFLSIIILVFVYSRALRLESINLYIVPCCILPIVIRAFFDTRMALFTHVITILILGSIAPNSFEFVYMQIIAGMVALFSIVNLSNRSQLFIATTLIFIAYLVCYIGQSIIHEGSIVRVEWMNTTWLFANALLTLFAYPIIYIYEKIFGVLSDVKLIELSDVNTPLIRELSLKAPGTFQHSMQVANLAEAAVYRIGGNTLLVRVGAMYHDIGKMDMAMYFIENQTTQVNPHDELSFDESARIIISHVIKGIEKARKYNLPDLIIDFIRTHHGTTMVQYFYQSFLKNYPEKILHEEDFQYPGPIPFSKETAVLMMADSVEASSRSLSHPDEESIDELVESIIDKQIAQQQFINCDITFKDITVIKKIFKKMLMSIYHVRIEYPH
jgi:putative nucleotidyltransferase with HDIG domain